jgi:hypothetical protein
VSTQADRNRVESECEGLKSRISDVDRAVLAWEEAYSTLDKKKSELEAERDQVIFHSVFIYIYIYIHLLSPLLQLLAELRNVKALESERLMRERERGQDSTPQTQVCVLHVLKTIILMLTSMLLFTKDVRHVGDNHQYRWICVLLSP